MTEIKDTKVMIWVPEKKRMWKVYNLIDIIIYIKNRLNNKIQALRIHKIYILYIK